MSAYTVLVEKSEGKKPLGRCQIVRGVLGVYGMEWSG
jgi:hypothetical protein